MIRCAIIGASGYSGAELVTLLSGHPEVEIASLVAESSAGARWEELYPARRHLHQGVLEPFDPDKLAGLDLAFIALPHGAAASTVATLRGRVGRIIDLSGDLRLTDARSYESWYGRPHSAPELLGQALYAVPELCAASELREADLISCAGCYASVIQLCAAPALAHGDAIGSEIVVAAQSGATGAGRKAELGLSLSELAGDLRAYRIGRHQHVPEIIAGLERHTGRQLKLTFVPHLVPITRGILASVVLPNPGGLTTAEALAIYRRYYADSPLVRVCDADRTGHPPAVRDVVGTSFCDLAPIRDEAGGTLVVVGVIDNLLKGAAGQAVQLMNLAHGLDETRGLVPDRAALVEA